MQLIVNQKLAVRARFVSLTKFAPFQFSYCSLAALRLPCCLVVVSAFHFNCVLFCHTRMLFPMLRKGIHET